MFHRSAGINIVSQVHLDRRAANVCLKANKIALRAGHCDDFGAASGHFNHSGPTNSFASACDDYALVVELLEIIDILKLSFLELISTSNFYIYSCKIRSVIR